jgi:tetratricopeptide (TPR) repeat protein
MNSTFVSILQQLVSEQGKEALLNPARCKAFLADYTKGEYKKESRLLLQALDAGVPKAIDTAKELEICKQQQVGVLREEHFLAVEVAADVVDTLAFVLKGEAPRTQAETQKAESTPVQVPEPQPEAKPQPVQSPKPTVQAPIPTYTAPAPSPPPYTPINPPMPTVPPKKKHTARNVFIAIVAIALGGLIINWIIEINYRPSYSGSTAAPSSSNANQQNAKSFFDRGETYYNNNDFANAITQLSEAIRLDPNYSEAYSLRGAAYSMKDEYDTAIRDFNEAIRLDPSDAWAYYWRGSAYRMKSQYDTAIRDYNEAIKFDPSDAFSYAGRGEAYRGKGDYDAAIKDFNEAIRLSPNYAFAYAGRGQTYRLMGQRTQAIQDLEKAISINPNYEWAIQRLREIRGN